MLWHGRPTLLYTIPVHNNPTGTTLGLAGRVKLLQLAHKFNFTIIADEVYQLLTFPDSPPPPPPLRVTETDMLQRGLLPAGSGSGTGNGAHASGDGVSASGSSCLDSAAGASTQGAGQDDVAASASRVVSLGSFSKIMAPGMRLG